MTKDATPMLDVVNALIKTGKDYKPDHDNYVDPNLVSDGFHTFGELYEHRITLFIALCYSIMANHGHSQEFKVWKSKLHHDGSSYDGWFIMGIGKVKGEQISYHLPMSKWDESVNIPEYEKAPKWDGHTSNDVLERLKSL